MSETLKSAGLLEHYHIARHSLGFDSCIIGAAKYEHPGGVKLEKQILYPALTALIEKHAALGARITDEDSAAPKFARLGTIDLSKVVQYADKAQSLTDVMEAEFQQPFNTTLDLPLWRITVLEDTVVFAAHHAICDGLSLVAFHRELLNALSSLDPTTTTEPSENIAVPKTTAMISPLESFIDVSPSWWTVICEVAKLFIPTSWTAKASAWTGKKVTTHPSLKTRVNMMQFSAQDVRLLTEICRAHRATLTSALNVLAVSVLSGIISAPPYASPDIRRIHSTIPVSVRPQCGTPSDAFCDHVSSYNYYPTINPNFSWDDAWNLTTTLRTQSSTIAARVGLLRLLFGQYKSYLQKQLGGKRECGLELSNLGYFQSSACGGGWIISTLCFAQCNIILGAAININVATAPSGIMTITVSCSPDTVDEEIVDTFTSRFQEEIENLTRS